jgi:hypothetical protein
LYKDKRSTMYPQHSNKKWKFKKQIKRIKVLYQMNRSLKWIIKTKSHSLLVNHRFEPIYKPRIPCVKERLAPLKKL